MSRLHGSCLYMTPVPRVGARTPGVQSNNIASNSLRPWPSHSILGAKGSPIALNFQNSENLMEIS